MHDLICLAGPNQAVELLGVRLVGFKAENGGKLVLTLAVVLLRMLLERLLWALTGWLPRGRRDEQVVCWTRQVIRRARALRLLLGVGSIGLDDPTPLAWAQGDKTPGRYVSG